VKHILGIPYGYEGLDPAFGHEPVALTPESVLNITTFGGSMLGSSRGKRDVKVMADHLETLGVDILFVIGGDGSQRGARAIHEELRQRGRRVAVVGVPKTIDNDIMFMDRSFGYQTAFAMAFHAVKSAHTEAHGARNGIGLVKLMGRDSGFIACSAALATGEANVVLIPEVPFRLEGEDGLLALLERRIAGRGHAVVITAEGAGQDLIGGRADATDASGNKLHDDIGLFLKERVAAHFKQRQIEINLKYIDPSYLIRSVPASPEDRIFCLNLGRHAVHAAMAGKTGMVVALWHQSYVHLPMSLVTRGRRKVDPRGDLWRSVIESTGQPFRMGT
jgi:6-phosphofructokinase 1